MSRQRFIALVVAALLVTSFFVPVSIQARVDIQDNKDLVVEGLQTELWENGNLDMVDDVLAENFVAHFWGGAADEDRDAYIAKTITPVRAAMPDFAIIRSFVLADGDYVVVGDVWGGTFENTMGEIPPTGEEAWVRGVEVARIENGKIAELWIMSDMLSFYQQLGAMPAEGDVLPQEPWNVELCETCRTSAEHKHTMMTMFNALNAKSVDGYFAPWHENAVIHDMGFDRTLAEAQAHIAGLQQSFPDHQTADWLVLAEGDLVVSIYTLTFVKDQIETPMINIDRFVDGLIAEEWWFWDDLTLQTQMNPPADE